MATISRFEDLESWKESRILCQIVRDYTRKDNFRRDYDLVRQIRRSSGSVMDNIAEGFDRNGNREFINFLTIAKASAAETRSQFHRALDYEYINEVEFKKAHDQSVLTSKLIAGFINYLLKSDIKGTKFKNR